MSINIGYFVSESIQNFRRNWVMTLGAIITIALTTIAEGNLATAPQIAALALMVLGTGIFLGRPTARPDKNPGTA